MTKTAGGLSRIWSLLTGSPRLTFVGHSHLWAIGDGLQETTRDIRVIDFWKISDPFAQNELSVIDTALPSPVRGPIVSLIGGSRYNTLTLYESARPFDFVLPSDPSPPETDCEMLPYHAVRTALLSLMESNFRLLKAVRERTKGRVYHLNAPPPWGEDRDPADYPKDPWMQVSHRFGDRKLRLKTSRLETDLMREFCATNDIVLIDVPEEAKDAEGFLRTEYFADLMHANTAYGRLVLAHVLGVVKK